MKNYQKWVSGILAVSAVVFAPATTSADEQESVSLLRQQIEELDQKIRILERKQELGEESTTAEFKKIPNITASDSGLRVQSKDKKYEFRFGGLVQVDYRNYINDQEATDGTSGFSLRRVRPRFRGVLWEKLSFDFQPELVWGAGNNNTVRILDVYGNYKFDDQIELRFGQFKAPVGLERLQSGGSLLFIERGLATNLVPTRDIGVQLHGKLFEEKLEYASGIFGGVNDGYDNRTNGDLDEDVDFGARLFARPFNKTGNLLLEGLGFGIAGSIGSTGSGSGTTAANGNSGNRIQYVSSGQTAFFQINQANAALDGVRYRLNPQLTYYYGPWGFLGEYVLSSQEYDRNGTKTLDNQAYTVQGSYVLTGEDASFTAVKPTNPFNLKNGGWGAWEIAGRFGGLTVDSSAFQGGASSLSTSTGAQEAHEWGVGLNWYLNTNLKWQFNYQQTWFDAYARNTARVTEDVFLTRLQVAF
jgi:phosphate-selective porin OprO and OprP